MRSDNDLPDRQEGGLSTDDLAQPTGETAQPAEETAGEAPVYPGEATQGFEEQGETRERETDTTGEEEEAPALLSPEDEEGFRKRWQEIQGTFVDDPRDAVHAADSLVADVMQTLASTFAQHKHDLEGQWSKGEEADTEELRNALRRYRSFFNRLLST
ncbi:hypothetical protein [Streptomyces orinoci]|uniref:Uncharacterized protein n=1 Tax=Streptomyces orinoci TaxID=67339 RepID=A0ABV3K4S0_STRON|nr:hypothetical protein [Streptomyces orinoci]